MDEKNNVLISVRCDTELAKKIDNLAKANGYQTRSPFVRKLIIDALKNQVAVE